MLNKILNKHKSDKSRKHHYDLIYEKDFCNIRNNKIRICEIGILGGSSLKTWLEYFPNAEIYAVDIIDKNAVEILNHPRIKYLKHDSTDKNIVKEIQKWKVDFDIIIEDGLHTPIANQRTFENFWPFLKDKGTYYIEDFFPLDIMTDLDYSSKSGKWVRKNPDWNIEEVNNFLKFISNYSFETFDNRAISLEQDSFIFKITK
jgi:cephalosporin hydroxylase